jgi:hypothetical protein
MSVVDVGEAGGGVLAGEAALAGELMAFFFATNGCPQRVQRFPLPSVPHDGHTNNSTPHWSQ